MSDPVSNLPAWQLARLDALIDALGDPPMSYPERASLAIIAGNDETTIDNFVAVLGRVVSARRFTGGAS